MSTTEKIRVAVLYGGRSGRLRSFIDVLQQM